MKRLFDARQLPLVAMLVALVMTLAVPGRPAAAQTAYANSYRTTLAYMNLGSTTAQITFTFNPESGSPLNKTATLAPNAATFLTMVNTTGMSSLGFAAGTNATNRRGNVVVSSTQRIIAVVVQTDLAKTGTFTAGSLRTRNRLLTSGFTSDSVDTSLYIPTYVKNAGKMSSRLAIQNAAGSQVSYVARFFGTSATPVLTKTGTIAANKAVYLDALATAMSSLSSGFTGSAIVTATGGIVASVIEAQSATTPASLQPANAMMGIPAAATAQLINLPSALCSGSRSTTLAVQNAGSTTTNVTPILIGSSSNITGTPFSVEPGVKKVVKVCDISASFTGAMQLSSDTENIAVIAKEDGGGHSSAFEGQPTTAAGDTLVAPYVRNAELSRYNNTASGRLRSSITIQNVGSTALSADDVVVNYYDAGGFLVGTHTITSTLPVGGSVSSNPGQMTLNSELTASLSSNSRALNGTQQGTIRNNFGYFRSASAQNNQTNRLVAAEGGGAVITCAADVVECKLLATVRVTGNNTATNGATTNNHAEMYNAVPTN